MKNIVNKCPKCGASVKKNDLFCGLCGCKIEDSSARADENNSERYLSAKEATEQNKSKQIFIDSDEQIVQTLGNGYLQNIVSSRGVTKTTAVLTSKRLYFSGIGFEKDGRIWKKIRVSKIIDLEDITGTGFINVSHIVLLIFAILGFLAFIAVMIHTAIDDYLFDNLLELSITFLFTALPGGIFMLLWLEKRITLFNVEYAGGKIGFDVKWLNSNAVADFQKQIHLMKSHKISEQQLYGKVK